MKGHLHGSILILTLMKGQFTSRCRSSKLSLCQTLRYCWPSQQDNRRNFNFKIKVVLTLFHFTIKHKLLATFISAQAPSKTARAARRNICKQSSAGRDSRKTGIYRRQEQEAAGAGCQAGEPPPEQGEGGRQPRGRGQKEKETPTWPRGTTRMLLAKGKTAFQKRRAQESVLLKRQSSL